MSGRLRPPPPECLWAGDVNDAEGVHGAGCAGVEVVEQVECDLGSVRAGDNDIAGVVEDQIVLYLLSNPERLVQRAASDGCG